MASPLATLITLFGGTGDVSRRLVYPALEELLSRGILSDTQIVTYGRSDYTTESWRVNLADWGMSRSLADLSLYCRGQYDSSADMASYATSTEELLADGATEVLYVALPTSAYEGLLRSIISLPPERKINQKIVIEKPFGLNAKETQYLRKLLEEGGFQKGQIYLLDHYLGKPSLRSLSELICSDYMRQHGGLSLSQIRSMEIFATEDIGVEHRLGYFESVGILGDMLQSHLLSLTGTVLSGIRDGCVTREGRLSVLESLIVHPDYSPLLAQYKGYCSQDRSFCDPSTETFSSLTLTSSEESMSHIQVHITVGKMLSRKTTALLLYLDDGSSLRLHIAPEEKLCFLTPEGIEDDCMTTETLVQSPHAALLLDILSAKKDSFLLTGEAQEGWRIVESIHAHHEGPIAFYSPGRMPDGFTALQSRRQLMGHVPLHVSDFS